MDTYKCTVTLVVEVMAPSESDAKEVLEDNFELGDYCGVNIKKFTVADFSRA